MVGYEAVKVAIAPLISAGVMAVEGEPVIAGAVAGPEGNEGSPAPEASVIVITG